MSFINPIFLAAIGAALLPVLYHFVRKMRAKKVPFSSLMFLKATPEELIKKRRLRDLLLMAIRAAIFGLLALAFARPFIPQEHIPFVPQQQNQSVVLLIDNSYSMQYGDWFEQARAEARNRLDAADGADEVAVVAFADGVQQLTSLSTDHALHRNALQRTLSVSNRATDFYAALRHAEELLQDARHPHRRIVLVSDFQHGGWTGALDNWTLDASIDLVPVRVGGGEPDNAYVEAFDLTTRRAGSEVAVRFDARVASQEDGDPVERAVRLLIGGAEVDARDVTVRSTPRVSFQQVAPREGVFQGQLALDDDNLSVDDRFYFTYAIDERPALLVAGNETGRTSDRFFLERAFNVGDAALYRYEAIDPAGLSESVLQDRDVVFLTNVEQGSGVQRTALIDYVERGGGLVLSFGARSDPAALSTFLEELGVGRADDVVQARSVQGTDAIIGDVDRRHPVFDVFAASSRGALLRPTFRRYVKVAPDPAAVVVGRYDTGDPFLLERRRGQGTVLVYTSSLNTRWTDLPTTEMYVPFIYELAGHAHRAADVRRLFTVGDAVALDGEPSETWDVRTPDGRVSQVLIEASGTGFFRETDMPGHYAASNGTSSFLFSVNVDARESDLRVRDVEEVYAALVPPDEKRPRTPEEASALPVEDEEAEQKGWRYVVLLVVGLFALETVLANRRVGGV